MATWEKHPASTIWNQHTHLIMALSSYLSSLEKDLSLDVAVLQQIATAFEKAMVDGLAGKTSSLKMLPSFIGIPTGKEKGAVIAVDFGGSNVRVIDAQLDGASKVEIKQMKRFPLVDPKGAYNYVNQDARAEELFGFIAQEIGSFARPGVSYSLGHTFSFPCEQTGINQARLIHWTKEFKTQGVEGKDIALLLDTALAAKNVTNVKGTAVINDTVGTQLAAAYTHQNVDIASICGTGHNTCYLQPAHPLTGKPMIVNMESGNFDGAPQSRFDVALDQASDSPGSQRLEKMISGYYLGEVFRRILGDMSTLGLLPKADKLTQKHVLTGYNLDRILADMGELPETAAVLGECLGWTTLTLEQRKAVQTVMTLVARRSARLVASTFCGTIHFVDAGLTRSHAIAIDGSLYEKMPQYAVWLQAALDELLPQAAGRVTTLLAKDGSGIGAAIAAATAAASST